MLDIMRQRRPFSLLRIPLDTSEAMDRVFLTLWKDADPGIAEVEDAKKRLADLQGQ